MDISPKHKLRRGDTVQFFLLGILLISSSQEAMIRDDLCPAGIDSAKITFSNYITHFGLITRLESIKKMDIHFTNHRLSSWVTEVGDLVNDHVVKPIGCGTDYGAGRRCSIGFWHDSSDCFVSGQSIDLEPSYIVPNFGKKGDLGIILIDQERQSRRQILIYRPNAGVVYSQSRLESPTSRQEGIVDSIEINGRHIPLQTKQKSQRSEGSSSGIKSES